jgi:hypothetical protein
MAVTTALTQAELARVMSEAYSGKVLTAALVNAASAPATDAGIASWLQYELTEGTNGYARFQSAALTGGTYSATNTRYEQDSVSVEFSANGGNLTYTHVVLLVDAAADGQAGAGLTASSAVDPATDVITVASHGLSDGDAVTVTVDSGGTLPGGLTAGTLYYVDSVTSSTITLHTATPVASGNKVNLTSTGSGTLRIRKCAGSVYGILSETAAVTISNGQTVGYSVKLAVND